MPGGRASKPSWSSPASRLTPLSQEDLSLVWGLAVLGPGRQRPQPRVSPVQGPHRSLDQGSLAPSVGARVIICNDIEVDLLAAASR